MHRIIPKEIAWQVFVFVLLVTNKLHELQKVICIIQETLHIGTITHGLAMTLIELVYEASVCIACEFIIQLSRNEQCAPFALQYPFSPRKKKKKNQSCHFSIATLVIHAKHCILMTIEKGSNVFIATNMFAQSMTDEYLV